MEIESKMASVSDGSSPSDPTQPRRVPEGWRAIKYILGNESIEKLASMSLIANIVLYLKTKYNLNGIFLVNVVSIWNGSSNIACLVGAFVSDSYLGRFKTLLFGCISSLLGMGTITLTAGLHKLRPPACPVGASHCPQPETWQLGVLFLGLAFLSVGAGGIRPCNIAFGADQFDTTTTKGKAQLNSFFNWWYLSFTLALLIALTGVVYVQTNVSWVAGFAIPTACLALSISIFLIGRHTYIYAKPQGSIFVDMAKVISAAFRKRKEVVGPRQELTFHDPPVGDYETKLARTDRFRFLDKAAVITDPSELDSNGDPRNGWRLCNIQQVEQLKCLVAVLPVWVSGIVCFVVMDQQSTFGILEALQINRKVGSHDFQIPPAWMGITSMISLSIWILTYEYLYIPMGRKVSAKNARLTVKQRIWIGIVMSILCMVVSGIVEGKRRDAALRHGTFVSPLSIAVLLPQFVLSGLTEAFVAVAMMEFLTMQMPENMRTVAGAIFFLTLSISSYLGSFIVNIIHKATKRGGRPWLGGHDLNQNRLDYYYYIIAAMGFVNFLYFTFVASRYISIQSRIDNISSSQDSRKHSKCDDEEKSLEISHT